MKAMSIEDLQLIVNHLEERNDPMEERQRVWYGAWLKYYKACEEKKMVRTEKVNMRRYIPNHLLI